MPCKKIQRLIFSQEDLKQIKKITLASDYDQVLKIRGDNLDNKCAECPHCESSLYIKFGKSKTGVRRYYCKNCKTGFNEYTGTWINGLHNKDKIYGVQNLTLLIMVSSPTLKVAKATNNLIKPTIKQ